MQIIKISILLALLSSILFSEEFKCKVDDRIMYGIACIEKHNKRPVGYPYLISLNNKSDQKKAKENKVLKPLFLDTRTIDCKDAKQCVKIYNLLHKIGIKNLDNGGFQINNLFWTMNETEDYFDVKKSYIKACEIVQSYNIKEWSWENIAKYHSKTENLNKKYKKILLSAVERTYKE